MDEGRQLRATVVTVSDEIHSGKDSNRAGPLAVDLLAAHGVRAELVVVPDDQEQIRIAVAAAVASGSRMVLTCGGTGIGPTDVTVDAVVPLLAYQMPGISEEIRRRGAIHVASALVSREVAGVVLEAPAPVFVITAPGSRGGVRDAVEVVGPLLSYIVGQLDGAGHL
ncbi:MAG TPA: molybdopterin-binding protein [Propionicimonas sp.]|jgi:molybdenum cofactor synthesis domain-containing protein